MDAETQALAAMEISQTKYLSAELHKAEARVAELEDLIRRTLNLRSTFDREQGRDVPLVNNWQARDLLERALKGK